MKLLDLVAGKLRFETNVSNGVCGVEFDRNDIEMNKLVARAAHCPRRWARESTVRVFLFLGAARTLPSCRCERRLFTPAAVNRRRGSSVATSGRARLFTARGVSRSSQTDSASAQTACTDTVSHSRENGQTDRDRLVGERGRAEGERSTRRTCNAGPHDARVALPPLRHADAPSRARLLLPLAGAATE